MRLPVGFLDGVDLLGDQRRIPDGSLTLAKNLIPTSLGRLGKRPAIQGVGILDLLGGAGSTDAQVTALIPLPWGGGWAFLYTLDGVTYLYVAQDMGVSSITPPGSVISASLGGLAQDGGTLIAWNNKVYAFGGNGCGIVGKYIGENDTACTTFAFADSQVIPIFPQVVFPYRERLIYANLRPGYGSHVVMSDDANAFVIDTDVLASNGRSFALGNSDEDSIVAGVDVMLTEVGTPASSAALILKQYSAYLLTGELDQTGSGTSDLAVNRFNVAAGCASAKTVVKTPHGIIWAGHDDVWLFQAGQIPRPIGTKIRARLLESAATARTQWHAAYHNGFYRLAVASPGTSPGTYDPMGEQWWLDLREGAPTDFTTAKWWGPQVFSEDAGTPFVAARTGTRCMASSKNARGETQLFGAAIGNEGTPYVLLYQFDIGNTYDTTYPIAPLVVGEPTGDGTDVAVIAYTAHGMNYDAAAGTGDVVSVLTGNGSYIAGAYPVSNVSAAEAFKYTSSDVGTGGPFAYIKRGYRNECQGYGQEIASELRTREMDCDTPVLRKIFQQMDGDLFVSGRTRLTCELLLNGGETVYPFSKSLGSGNEYSVDTNSYGVLDTIRVGRTQQQVAFGGVDDNSVHTRRIAPTFQFRLYDSAGYIIRSDDTTLPFYTGASGAARTLYNATLTAGYYATLKALLDHICAAMTTARGLAFTHNVSTTPTSALYTPTITIASSGWVPDHLNSQFWRYLGFEDRKASAAYAAGVASNSGLPWVRSPSWDLVALEIEYGVIPRKPTL